MPTVSLINGLHFGNLKGDVYGGLTAAVVALPLALAFGVASGAGPVAGLYGAIFVGFFAAMFGGTPAQVSGPTGPMTVVMAGIITEYAHDPALAFTVVILGGLLQILFGVLRVGRYINLMPYPVISGFMSGIGCIIIILQLGPLVGHASPGGGPLGALQALPGLLGHPLVDATMLGVVSLAIVFMLPARIARLAPPPLVALLVGTLLAVVALPDASRIGEIPSGLPSPDLPRFELAALPGMINAAIVLALLGSIDSLLTSLIADSVTQGHHRSDRELIGQGIGNTLAGLMGAIPGAGATMRTVVNVRAGGRTPISGMLHAVVLLLVVLGLGGFAESIPHAVLAGILVKVGIDIIDWDYLRRLRQAPRAGVVIMLVVLALTVLVDLITAVGTGVVLASLLFVKRMADLQTANMRAIVEPDESLDLTAADKEILEQAEGRILLFHLAGPMSFASAKAMSNTVTAYQEHAVMILDLSDVPFIDSSTGLTIEEIIEQARGLGQQVLLAGARGSVATVLERLGVFRLLGEECRLESRSRALQRAREITQPGSLPTTGAPQE